MPEKMFVTCLYGVLDPETGHFRFANAGHDLPYVKTADGSEELRARGMPLGLMPGMPYEEKETVLQPGDSLLLHSDGIVEAHSPDREMFGFPRLKQCVADYPGGGELIDRVLSDLHAHTGPDAEQEDDITMVTLQRSPGAAHMANGAVPAAALITEFEVPSAEGNERLAIERVVAAVDGLGLAESRLERLKTAVGEATMNAMEHGSRYREDRPVSIRVLTGDGLVRVQITDLGGARPEKEHEVPDLEAKLEGLQRPRGWGLFLIENMVDETRETSDGEHHTLELGLRLEGEDDGDE
jgi:anti-sigma regulatory factor (Ser/Thr protein kinase)